MSSFDRRSIDLWNWFIVISNAKKHRDDPIDPDPIQPLSMDQSPGICGSGLCFDGYTDIPAYLNGG